MPNGNIVSSGRHLDSAFIIDRKSGDIIWRWGNVAYLDKETGQVEHRDIRGMKTLGGPHDAHIIAEDLPGAGNMLIYDNAMYRYFSRAVEVDIKTGDVVWESEQTFGIEGYVKGRVHFSPFISGANCLANGNTLICEGMTGRIFEVTAYQNLVWEYVNAFPGPEVVASPAESRSYPVYGAYRYGHDYPGLSGLKL